MADTLKTVEASLVEWQQAANTRKRSTRSPKDDATAFKQQVLDLDKQVRIDFDSTVAHLTDKQLPAEILKRHNEAVALYQQHLATLVSNLEAVEAATDATQLNVAVDKTLQHLQPLLTEGKHPEFDPNVLPFNVPKADVRAPLEDEAALKKLIPVENVPNENLRRPKVPDASYLAATEDVLLTPEVKALAQELGNNPVKMNL